MDRIRISITAIFLLCIASNTFAASFDCTAASSHIEKLICGDAELSKLDDDLNTMYRAHPEDKNLKSEQLHWLLKRNNCHDRECVRTAYLERINLLKNEVSKDLLKTSLSHYQGTQACNYAFDYPPTWHVTTLPDRNPLTCRVQVAPNDLSKRLIKNNLESGYTIEVSIYQGSFLQAADTMGFDYYKGAWVTVGRQGLRDDASVFTSEQWSGVKGTGTTGCSLAKTTVLCEEYSAVVQDDFDHVVTVYGQNGSDEVFDVILSSLKLTNE